MEKQGTGAVSHKSMVPESFGEKVEGWRGWQEKVEEYMPGSSTSS